MCLYEVWFKNVKKNNNNKEEMGSYRIVRGERREPGECVCVRIGFGFRKVNECKSL